LNIPDSTFDIFQFLLNYLPGFGRAGLSSLLTSAFLGTLIIHPFKIGLSNFQSPQWAFHIFP